MLLFRMNVFTFDVIENLLLALHFTLASKLFSLAVQGSGALLSSNLEGALYINLRNE